MKLGIHKMLKMHLLYIYQVARRHDWSIASGFKLCTCLVLFWGLKHIFIYWMLFL